MRQRPAGGVLQRHDGAEDSGLLDSFKHRLVQQVAGAAGTALFVTVLTARAATTRSGGCRFLPRCPIRHPKAEQMPPLLPLGIDRPSTLEGQRS